MSGISKSLVAQLIKHYQTLQILREFDVILGHLIGLHSKQPIFGYGYLIGQQVVPNWLIDLVDSHYKCRVLGFIEKYSHFRNLELVGGKQNL